MLGFGYEVLVQFNRHRATIQTQLVQQLSDVQRVRVLLGLVVYSNIHGGTLPGSLRLVELHILP